MRATRTRALFVAVGLMVAVAGMTHAAVVTQYSFENNLNDTAAGGTADNLAVFGAGRSESYQAGIVGQAVKIDTGATDAFRLRAVDSNDLDLAANFTIEAFVRPDLNNTGEWDRFWCKWGDGGNNYHWTFRRANNGLDFFENGAQRFDGGTNSGVNTVPPNTWSHVAVVGDGSTIKGYIDGNEVVSAGYVAPTAGPAGMNFGNFDGAPSASQFSGLIDEAMIHNTNVSPAYLAGRAALLPTPPPGPTTEDFDTPGTPSTTRQLGTAPGPAVLAGGPTGNFLRLINDGVNNNKNAIAFDQTGDGVNPSGSVEIDFDVRFTEGSPPPADGAAMVLIPTSTYGTSGDGPAGSLPGPEEPNIPGAFAIGIDLHPAASVNDISVHWNGAEIANVVMPNANLDWDAGVFHRVHAKLTEGVGTGGDVAVTVTITPDIHGTPGTPYTPINNVTLTGMGSLPDYRVEFAGRTGGLNVSMDLDNINVANGPPLGGTATFADFSDVSKWVFNGTATQVGDRIRLTEDATSQGGSAFHAPRLRLDDGNAFNAEFSFVIGNPRDGNNAADGLALVLHDDPRGWSALGGLGGAIGQDNITPRLAIIVEDYQTPQLQIRTSTGAGNTQIDLDPSYATGIRDGAEWFVWADYDGTTDLLEVFLSSTDTKPGAATLSSTIDLVSLFGGEDELIVGFTGATGGAYAEHDILSMSFNGAPSAVDIPEPATMCAMALAFAGLGGYVRKRKRA